jgi:hypothetical protein
MPLLPAESAPARLLVPILVLTLDLPPLLTADLLLGALRLLVVEVRHGLVLESVVIGPFVLELVGRIDEELELRVAIGHDAEGAACVVVVREDLVHDVVHEVCDELEPEFEDLLLVPLEALLAHVVGHGYRFKGLRQAHGVLALGKPSARNEDRPGLRGLHFEGTLLALGALGELSVASGPL